MKKTIFATLCALAACFSLQAANINYTPGDVKATNVNAGRNDNTMFVSMNLDASALKLKSNQEVIITPLLTDGSHELRLEPITVAGRNRWYFHKRNNDALVPNTTLFRNGDKSASIPYQANFKFEPWMDMSKLCFDLDFQGCCDAPYGEINGQPIANIDVRPTVFEAEFVYETPKTEGVKIRKESGSAFIDFVVNKTIINADYRNNARELAKIAETIDKVRNDKDVTITDLSIKGYASPEGPYKNNERLAKGRTEALMTYVRNLYNFPGSVKFHTSYEAEDWNGLRKYVEESNINNRQGILDLINSSLAPDEKDQRIKKDFPTEYAFLLANVYPALRHSDYEVKYTVRNYTTPQEILKVFRESPGKLSLNELFLAGNSLQPGSDEYNEVFETAVRLYPSDPVANLNAANAAMIRKDYKNAAKYLDKAGNTPNANYGKGILKAIQGDYEGARAILSALDMPKARTAVAQIEKIISDPVAKITMLGGNK